MIYEIHSKVRKLWHTQWQTYELKRHQRAGQPLGKKTEKKMREGGRLWNRRRSWPEMGTSSSMILHADWKNCTHLNASEASGI
jgi:hypothetical protein